MMNINRFFFLTVIFISSISAFSQTKTDYVVVGKDTLKVTIAGKPSGIFLKESIVRAQFLKVSNPNYTIESFYLTDEKKSSIMIFNNTGKLNPEVKTYLTNSQPGDKLKIDSIKAKNKEGKTIELRPISITIK